jgi:hypothetical protein
MSLTASLLLAATLSSPSAPATTPMTQDVAIATPIAAAVARIRTDTAPATTEAWRMDVPQKRPAALPVLYATLGALQAFDVYSTRRAIDAGAYEANPLMERAAKNGGTMLALKALSTAGTIYFTERAWKKNRKGAIVLIAAINGMTAAISARNLRNAR